MSCDEWIQKLPLEMAFLLSCALQLVAASGWPGSAATHLQWWFSHMQNFRGNEGEWCQAWSQSGPQSDHGVYHQW